MKQKSICETTEGVDLLRLTDVAHALVRHHIRAGDAVIDATVGNGHDTLHLADLVGPNGIVYGFDIQPIALENARQLLGEERKQVTLIQAGHERMREHCRGPIAVAMFNLGYLPGGEKNLTTNTTTTLLAVRAAIDLLKLLGVLTVIAYRGHAGGTEETNAVRDCLNELADAYGELEEVPASDSPTAPVLVVFRKWKATS